jgi:hypothetical protein
MDDKVTCDCCNWMGLVYDLIPDDDSPTAVLRCPQCNSSGWTFD